MKNFNKKIITSTFIFFIILLLSISILLANNVLNELNVEVNEEKIYYEIKYFDSKIIYMSKLINNSQGIDWKELENQTNILYNYWNSAILDLNYLDINKKSLTDFGINLDTLSISIIYKNEQNTLKNLIDLYKKLTIYIDEINYDNYKNIMLTKYNLLVSSIVVKTENWTLTNEYIIEASKHINKLVNTININQYSQYNINKAYVAVKEMENLINVKDIGVFYLKYNIALDKLENL